MEASERFFSNKSCRFFPCHKGVKEEDFNCMFCYCPLYHLGRECGGDFVYKNGVKSCIGCSRPHTPEGYDEIREVLGRIAREQRSAGEYEDE